MKSILVPVDGALSTDRAIDHLRERLGRGGPPARIALLYVHEPPIRGGKVGIFQRAEDLAAQRALRAREVLDRASAQLGQAGWTVECLVAEGPLYATIAREAERLGVEEVVLGVRPPPLGRVGLRWIQGLRRFFTGLPAQVTIVH